MTSVDRTRFLPLPVFVQYSWLFYAQFVNILNILVIYWRRLYLFIDMLYARFVGNTHGGHGVSIHLHIYYLFNSLLSKGNKNAPRYWSFFGGKPQVDSPHKGPVMRKAFPCNEVIMKRVVYTKTWKAKSIKTSTRSHVSVHEKVMQTVLYSRITFMMDEVWWHERDLKSSQLIVSDGIGVVFLS